MALYEVVVEQSYAGQQCINRFNYVSSGTPSGVTGSFGLIAALGLLLEGEPVGFPADMFGALWNACSQGEG